LSIVTDIAGDDEFANEVCRPFHCILFGGGSGPAEVNLDVEVLMCVAAKSSKVAVADREIREVYDQHRRNLR